MRLTAIGIDLAKSVFQVHGVDERGRVAVRRKLSRAGLKKFVMGVEPTLIGVEACGGARFWVREIKKHGHDVRMIPAQFVKPFVKSDKNDANDAEAICEALQRPNMRFVAEKSSEQEQAQTVHRVRANLVGNRTEIVNELRAILSDYDTLASRGVSRIREKAKEVLSATDSKVPPSILRVVQSLLKQLTQCDEEIAFMEQELDLVFQTYEVCRRLVTIPGVGKLTATAIFAKVSSASDYKSGRHLAASLGLVPRQNSSGGRQSLSGITKRGDAYLRSLLVHGGRAVVRTTANKTDKRSLWVAEKAKTRGKNKAAVAVANKNARVIWKILKTQEVYKTS